MTSPTINQTELVGSIRKGDVLAGKYRVDRILGAGGMGVVVAAHHLQLDERVAIKFLLPEGLSNPEVVARFDREARAAVKIKNEHVARMIDVGRLDNGAPYIVMEYLDGTDLANMLRSRGSLPIEEAVEFILQACEAIAEAHAIGIVHRDLKPANLFVVRRGDGLLAVKVLDFGISKVTSLSGSGHDMGMTKTATVMGSPLYMSPEQMASARNVDARTDIWAIGIVLYELLTGRVPFVADTMTELVVKVLTAAPEPLLNFRPDAPAGIDKVILRCLEKDRDKRFGNVGEFAVALVEFGPKRARASAERVSRTVQAAGLSASALALPPSSDQVGAATTPVTNASWGRTEPGEPQEEPAGGGRRRLLALLVVGAVAALALVEGAMLLSKRGTQTAPEQANMQLSVPSAGVEAPTPSTARQPTTAVDPTAPAPPIATETTQVAARAEPPKPSSPSPRAAGSPSSVGAAQAAAPRPTETHKPPVPKKASVPTVNIGGQF